MNSANNNSEPAGVKKKGRLKGIVFRVLTVLLIMTVSGGLFFWGQQPEIVAELKGYGFAGAFLISLVGNGTILLPGVVLPILSTLGAMMYSVDGVISPVIVGLVGGLGAAIGEVVGYVVGRMGRGIVRDDRMYLKRVGWLEKWGVLAIFVVSMAPLLFDLVGIAAGILRYPFWKFFFACWTGRTILYVTVIVLAALGWEAVLDFFG